MRANVIYGYHRNMVSVQFYNNAQCRRDSGIIGPPDGGPGDIGIPMRGRLLQGGGREGGPEGEGGPEDGGPEQGHEEGPEDGGPEHEQPPEERGPPEGEISEVATFDSDTDVCQTSTATILGKISDFDSSVAAVATVSYNTFFDFSSHGFGSAYNLDTSEDDAAEGGATLSGTATIILWAIAGLGCGYGIVYTYESMYGSSASVPAGVSSGGFVSLGSKNSGSTGSSFMRDAMQDSSSSGSVGVNSRHGLLSFANKEVNYEEEVEDPNAV
jgi:hypothetical protein